jgi:uncharacterized membrane protein YfcA
MPSLLVLSLLAISALVTSFISGILGMAGGMILMGILLSVLPLPVAMMVVLALVGTSLSQPVLKRMNDASFRLWTRWTVMSLGVFYLISGILLLVQ